MYYCDYDEELEREKEEDLEYCRDVANSLGISNFSAVFEIYRDCKDVEVKRDFNDFDYELYKRILDDEMTNMGICYGMTFEEIRAVIEYFGFQDVIVDSELRYNPKYKEVR